MNRRRFLREGLAVGGLTLGAGGFLFVRRNQARAEMTARMLDDALPPLTAKSLKELEGAPVQAREEIRRFFDGKCLNVARFVSHISSTSFTEELGRCPNQEERERRLNEAFFSRVATPEAIVQVVDTIATEVGSELDLAWGEYRTALSSKWNTRIQGYGGRLTADALTQRVDPPIRADMDKAVKDALAAGQKPALGQTIGNIGKSAVLLLPLMEFGQAGLVVGVPVFVVLAAKHIWDYVLGRLQDRRADLQAAISGRVALMGNRVGVEFEREVSQQITNLHTWQERSIRETAVRLAEEQIGLI